MKESHHGVFSFSTHHEAS